MLSLEVRQLAEKLNQLSIEDQQWLLQKLMEKVNSYNICDSNQSLIQKPKRKFGSAKGLISMSPDFDEPLEDFKDYM